MTDKKTPQDIARLAAIHGVWSPYVLEYQHTTTDPELNRRLVQLAEAIDTVESYLPEAA